jgi:hypothetical protein
MITLTGTLRQSAKVTFDGVDKTKLWIEHQSPRDNGVFDLKIEELILPHQDESKLPKQGEQISVDVRVYAAGRDVKFFAVGIHQPLKKAA